MDEIRFVVDNMLGKLARWLRILGYDTLYFKEKEDEALIKLADEEGRILLTRDTKLARNWEVPTLLIKSEEVFNQLIEVFSRFKLRMYPPFPTSYRCPLCNTLLSAVEKSCINEGAIPDYVLKSYSLFWYCSKCKKYYWEGSHWMNIKKTLSSLVEECRI